MNKKTIILIVMTIVTMTISAFAEEILTNEMIIKMMSANLGDTLIINKIKSSKNNFDLTIDAIIKLKQVGVSEKIIESMMVGEVTKETVSTSSLQLPSSGDFFLTQNGKLIEIPEHSGYQKMSTGKAFFSAGMATDLYYIIDGPKASLRIPITKENLVFVSKKRLDPGVINSGDLYRLVVKGRKYRYMVLSTTAVSPNSGKIKEEYKTKYEIKKNPDNTFTITTIAPLTPGEYAFAFGSTEQPNVAFFDFGIDEVTQTAQ